MVTSQHDYAQYLREISLDSLSGGTRGEKSYKYYSYAESCGKFMNTLLVLSMRNAKALETFQYDPSSFPPLSDDSTLLWD